MSDLYYLVFAAQADTTQDPMPIQTGARSFEYRHHTTGRLQWLGSPVGVFKAETAEAACRAAAKRTGTMGTFFAVEGTPWGVSMIGSDATELGVDFEESQSDLDRLERRTRELERSVGIGDE
jgi:hypothetical protein